MRSENYNKVYSFYKRKLWNIEQVHNVVNKLITPEEFEKITGEKYSV